MKSKAKKHVGCLPYVIIFIVLIVGCSIFFDTEMIELCVNEKICLPKATKVDTIYRFDYREGEDLSIFYYSKKQINKIISKYKFQQINEENRNEVYEKINEYWSALDDEEKKEFNKNVDINKLLNITSNNYYLINESSYDTLVILIIDKDNSKIYYLNSVQ